jgi:hypothetical protein
MRHRRDGAPAERLQRRRGIAVAGSLERISVPQPLRQERPCERVAGTGGVNRVDPEGRHNPALLLRGDQRAVLAERQRDDAAAKIQVEISDLLRRRQAGELAGIVEARPGDVGERNRRVDDGAGAVERPEQQAQVGVVADRRPVRLGVADGGEDRIRAGRRDRLADGGGVKDPRAADQVERQVGDAELA